MSYLDGAAPYLSLINGAEDHYGLPRNLLVRIAYQECSWRPEVINGSVKSPAGAVGMFQLMPEFFPGAGVSIAADCSTAARYLANLYQRFKDWQVALAAYNWGPGNVDKCLNEGGTLADMPRETENYVVEITADTSITGSLV